jgi:putative ABC transport system permease protein
MDRLRQDLRDAVRRLMADRSFTLIAALTLALGIGANTAIFSLLKAVLLTPLPYADPEHLVMLWNRDTPEGRVTVLSNRELWTYRQDATSYERIAGYIDGEANITGGQEPERVRVGIVTPDLFTTLGVSPAHGRVFGGAEGTSAGNNNVIVLSHALWTRRFGGDPSVIGRPLLVNGAPLTIIGVMPSAFRLPTDYRNARVMDAWVPLVIDPANLGGWGSRNDFVVGRLRPGVTPSEATTELAVLWKRWVQAGYVTDQRGRTFTRSALPIQQFVTGRVRTPLLILIGTVAFVLLIAVANVGNLELVRTDVRARDVAVRAALGASRGRLVRQALFESSIVAFLGGMLGVVLAWGGIRMAQTLGAATIPRIADARIDASVLMVTSVLAVLCGVLFGLGPALKVSTPQLNSVLHDGGRSGTAGRRRLIVRRAIVIGQTAMSVVLVLAAGLLTRSLVALNRVDLGFDPRNVLTAQVTLPRASYPDEARAQAFYRVLRERAEQLPGVERAGLVRILPLARTIGDWSISIEGRPDDPVENPNGDLQYASPGYFETMGIALLRGRAFASTDDESHEYVTIISQAMALKYWPGEDAIGKRFHLGTGPTPWLRVVGIAGQVHHNTIVEAPRSEIYVPIPQAAAATGSPGFPPRTVTLVMKTRSEPVASAPPLRDLMRQLDSSLPLSEVKSMEHVATQTLADRRFTTMLLGAFAALALLLATVGVYGTVWLIVSERTQEIGIRMALGAQRNSIVTMVLRQGLGMIAAGLALGIGVSAFLTPLLKTLLFGVTALDPATFVVVAGLLATIGAIASLLPARRAALLDPIETLRR